MKRTNMNGLQIAESSYILPKFTLFFSDKLAGCYEPIIYSHKCLSGPPEAVYYRIVSKAKTNNLCLQYFFYWTFQHCHGASHRYDYEPIFVYLKGTYPYLIVNVGLGGPDCDFRKIEIRPSSDKRERDVVHFRANLSPEPFYPFGGMEGKWYNGCSQTFPLNRLDLQFKDQRPLFGIPACSNVFSGAKYDLRGKIFNPLLKRLTDKVLNEWYFNHFMHFEDMPFTYDISDPFTYPFIKNHPLPYSVKDNGFEVRLNDMETNKDYPFFTFEDSKYAAKKNEKGELDLFEIKE